MKQKLIITITLFLVACSTNTKHKTICTNANTNKNNKNIDKLQQPPQKNTKQNKTTPIPYNLTLKQAATGTIYGSAIKKLKWSPNGKYLSFLRTNKNNMSELWGFEISTKKLVPLIKSTELVKQITENEQDKERRERQRISFSGITSYEWSYDGSKILFSLSNNIYVYDLQNKKVVKIYAASPKEAISEPRFAKHSSNIIAFVRNKKLTLLSFKNKKSKILIKTYEIKGQKASETRFYAQSEFIAGEEMSRYKGYWWSPFSSEKSGALVFTEVDENKVPIRKRPSIGADNFKIVSQRYPSAGKPNAKVSLLLYVFKKKPNKGKLYKIKLNKYEYIPRVKWINKDFFVVQTQNRLQTELKVNICNLKGKCDTILKDFDPKWVELHNNLSISQDMSFMTWSSENPVFINNKSPHRKATLLIYKLLKQKKGNYSPKLLKKLKLPKDETFKHLIFPDFRNQIMWILAYTNNGTELKVYKWFYTDNKLILVTKKHGWYSVNPSPNHKYYVEIGSKINSPLKLTVFDVQGNKKFDIPPVEKADKLLFKLPKPQFVQISLKNGTKLNGLLFKPANYDSSHKYPAIVYGYGGPHGQVASNRLSTIGLWSRYLADKGFIVLMFDGRGGLYKDYSFAKAPYKQFGRFETEDHLAAARFLQQRKDIIKNKIGIWGWSYGGYTVLTTLLSPHNIYTCGVAVAPPTDWTLYDTHYTERYLGLPNSSDVYSSSKINLKKLKNLRKPLLIVHGMSDDNVLLFNSLRIIKLMQDHTIPFELMLYPGKAHSIWGKNTRTHLLNLLTTFFIKHLK